MPYGRITWLISAGVLAQLIALVRFGQSPEVLTSEFEVSFSCCFIKISTASFR